MKFQINNKEYQYFSNYTITLQHNSIAHKFSFSAQKNLLDYILEYPDIKNFDFNISHSGQYVVLAISDKPVGIDIERIKTFL